MTEDASEEAPQPAPFTILGVTRSGSKFRPSDWPCRLAGPYGRIDGKVVRYHPDVQPVSHEGHQGVRVSTLNQTISQALAAFAESHDLVVVRQEPLGSPGSV